VHRFLEHVREIIWLNKQAEQRTLIALLNPVINGWARYYQFTSASQIFAMVDEIIWHTLWRWAKRRHPDKNRGWILRRYFGKVGTRSWNFRDVKTGYALVKAMDTRRQEYRFVVGGMSILDKAYPVRKNRASQLYEEVVREA